jgi:hypothetical protein
MKEDINSQPQKPEWAVVTALKSAALWAAVMAALKVASSRFSKVKTPMMDEAVNGAFFGGAIGALLGYLSGVRKNAEYPHEVETTKLRHEVDELKRDKSFVQAIVEQKAQKAPQADTLSR